MTNYMEKVDATQKKADYSQLEKTYWFWSLEELFC